MRAVLLASVALAHDPAWKEFEEYKANYGFVFDDAEEDKRRFAAFKENKSRAAALNAKAGGKATFGTTKFSHMTPQEFKEKMTGYKPKETRTNRKLTMFTNVRAGDKDWRGTGAVTPVKNQGACGSCWAFSATQAVETGYYFGTGTQKILSPQQTVSCDKYDGACGGGDTYSAYQYMQTAGGVELETSFPYTSGTTGERGQCSADSSDFVAKVTAVHTISNSGASESNMYQAIMKSPMSICVDAETWQMYTGGVVDSNTCGTQLDHCVGVVAIKQGQYWVVKNQWGTNWGEDGYIRVATGQNACGVAMEATTVDVAATTTALKDPVVTDAVELINGLSEGFGLAMEPKCVGDADDLMQEVEAAYAQISQKNPIAMARAMSLLADAIGTSWPKAAADCGATKAELDDLAKALSICHSPSDFLYHVGQDLKINGIDIYQNINQSVGHWKRKELEPFGKNVGAALRLLVVGSEDVYA